MHNFTPIPSLIGGVLIGVASAILLATHGRIAGISGIAGGALRYPTHERSWRLWFLAGLLVGGLALGSAFPELFVNSIERSIPALVVAGLLVGVGTQLGNGCTSGHGICGLSRFSPRSFAAVFTFMAVAAGTVAVVNAVFGGSI